MKGEEGKKKKTTGVTKALSDTIFFFLWLVGPTLLC